MKHLYKRTHCVIRSVLLVVMVVIMLASASVFAAESDIMPELENRSASLNIIVLYKDGDLETPIDGVEFTIYKVADVNVDHGSVSYTSISEFASAGINYEGMTASESMGIAMKLDQMVVGSGVKGSKAVSDGKGVAAFSNLPLGMYLVSQTAATGNALKYEKFNPFLVMVPSVGDDMEWIYDVEAFPKPTMTKIPETPSTGDETNITLWFSLLGIAAVSITGLLYAANKKHNE